MSDFELELAVWSAPAHVVAFAVDEAINEPYRIEVFARVALELAASLDDALDADGTLAVRDREGSALTTFRGVVTTVEVVRAMPEHAVVRLVLRPRLQRLALEIHSRVWVDKTFQQVLEELLAKGGITGSQIELTASYAPREHICQYHESDLEFLARWLEREGIRYFFDHDGDTEKLCLTDDPLGHVRSPAAAVRYYASDDDAGASGGLSLQRFVKRQGLATARIALSDYDYLRPTLALGAAEAVVPHGIGAFVDFGGNMAQAPELTRLAKVRAEEEASTKLGFAGSGSVIGLRSGYRFALEEHPEGDLNAEYLVTAARHRGIEHADLRLLARHGQAFRDLEKGATRATSYRVEVEAVSAQAAYRPRVRTPVPRIHGVEPARVDGPADSEYAQIDEHGRYHVKILFDENEAPAGQASAWVRMTQPHGGAPEGFHFPLRKGTEVMLGFVEGDPDRPVIAGVVPNRETPSPVTRANASQNVVLTGGENRLEIEDKAGEEYVALFSPPENTTLHLGAHAGPYHEGHNVTLRTDGNAKVHAGGDRHVTVGGEQTEDVKGLVRETYHSTQSTHVFGAWDETIDGGATQTISSGETRTVTGGVEEQIIGGETRTIDGDQSESVSASAERTVGANLNLTVGANADEVVSASRSDTIGASFDQTVTGGVDITTPAALNVTAGGALTFTAPAGFTVVAPGGIQNADGEWWQLGGLEVKAYCIQFYHLVDKLKAIGLYIHVALVHLEYNILRVEGALQHGGTDGINFEDTGAEKHDHGAHGHAAGAHGHT